MNFDNLVHFKYACFIYKGLHRLAPPPLNDFIKLKSGSGIGSRAVSRGDCEVPHRHSTFGQTVLSVKGSKYGNRHFQHESVKLMKH